jgi:hypothetical protein
MYEASVATLACAFKSLRNKSVVACSELYFGIAHLYLRNFVEQREDRCLIPCLPTGRFGMTSLSFFIKLKIHSSVFIFPRFVTLTKEGSVELIIFYKQAAPTEQIELIAGKCVT